MGIPLLDLHRQYEKIRPEMDRAVLNVLESCKFILGPEVKELEQKTAELCGTKYAIGCASGTDALLLALRAVGVKPGDEVITSDFSFFASAGVISRLGARPVFVDIESDTYNIDPRKIEAAITSRTRAIVPVHLYGQMADMDPIMEIARRRSVSVVEDAAQAIGSEYKGRKAGSIGDVGCFSYYPSKNLGAGGDAGMIVTNDEHIEKDCRSLRVHGENPKYYHHTVGYNSRLDTLQAAMLLVKMPYLREWSEKRIEHARIYDQAFAGIPNLTVPLVKAYTTFHIFNQYTIASPKRDHIVDGLNKAGIGNCIYYPLPFHMQKCFAYLDSSAEDFPVSTRAAGEVVSIPVYPEMTPSEQQEVIATVRRLATE
jgi:dTDP-4-amino-4,6-dideoxygalactose transaminase